MREALIHRPAVLLAAGMILGVVAPQQTLVCLAVLIALLALARSAKPGIHIASGFLIGAVLSIPSVAALPNEQWIDTQARVVSVPRLYGEESIQLVSFDGRLLQMAAPVDTQLALGDLIHIRGLAKPLSEGSERLLNRGVVGKIRPVSVSVIGSGPWLLRAGSAWRTSFTEFCDRWLPARTASEVEAVCFNVDSSLDQESKDQLSRSGLVHIVSASGMHVGILALAVFGVLSIFPIPRVLQILILAGVLALYAVASGLHPPVLRAGLMAVVLSSAFIFKREPDMLSALALAAVFQMFWDASAIFDPGFQLSFVVVGAFALFSTHSRRSQGRGASRLISNFRAVAASSLLATLAATPLVAYYFGIVSLTSIPANLLVAAALPVLVVCAMLAHLISLVVPALGVGILSVVVGPMTGWIGWVSQQLGGSWAAITVPAFSGYWVLLAYALMILAWRPRLRTT